MTALITLEDYWRKQFTVVLCSIASMDAAKAFAEYLESQSAAKLVCVSVKQDFFYDPDHKTPTDSGAYDSVDQRCKLVFRDLGNGDYLTTYIPAPQEELFEIDQSVKPTVISACKMQIEALIGRNLIFVNGGLTSDANVHLN